jgi:hypothetical protein
MKATSKAVGGPDKKSERFSYTHPISLGGCLLESLDDISTALAVAEGEASSDPEPSSGRADGKVAG